MIRHNPAIADLLKKNSHTHIITHNLPCETALHFYTKTINNRHLSEMRNELYLENKKTFNRIIQLFVSEKKNSLLKSNCFS